ncbi:unnamed protein product [Anisakis simplex]|uniref:CKLF like MARVEL transmembrane domain containing 3 n=1 Tax=Anisakis simplex TaxID=6269 RepID=A0A0M3J507_ANISI|nr:unnamed protein product [Anisakis simplex]
MSVGANGFKRVIQGEPVDTVVDKHCILCLFEGLIYFAIFSASVTIYDLLTRLGSSSQGRRSAERKRTT